MSENQYIKALIRKKMDKSISESEMLELKKWAERDEHNANLLDKIDDEALLLEDINLWFQLKDENANWLDELEFKTLKKINPSPKSAKFFNNKYLNTAASIFFVMGLSFITYRYVHVSDSPVSIADLEPGSNKARITLSDGKVINLREDQDGIVFGEDVNYKDGTFIEDLNSEKLSYAILETPKGGQYHITLSDGTQVWLNAASKLKYPIAFKGRERVVELEGEAYFNVQQLKEQGKKVPFLVKTSYQEIQVLGTQFNVDAYKREKDVTQKTTLVEGKVTIGNGAEKVLLTPGDQGVVSPDKIIKKKVDVNPYVAWVNNKFIFEDTNLREALEVLGRWYDFEYVVENPKFNIQLYASISRTKNFKEVLEILNKSEIKYRLENDHNKNKLIITN